MFFLTCFNLFFCSRRKSESSEASFSTLRKYLPQILAVTVKNVLLFDFGLSLGFPTILIPNLSGDDPHEIILLDQNGISWIGELRLVDFEDR